MLRGQEVQVKESYDEDDERKAAPSHIDQVEDLHEVLHLLLLVLDLAELDPDEVQEQGQGHDAEHLVLDVIIVPGPFEALTLLNGLGVEYAVEVDHGEHDEE